MKTLNFTVSLSSERDTDGERGETVFASFIISTNNFVSFAETL